jgi:membrane-associated phospholipid phosphatase
MSSQNAPKQSWSLRHPVLKKNLIILALVLVAEVALLSFNARLDTMAWRATRWFMGNQAPYNWDRVKENAKLHPHAPWWRTVTPPLHSHVYHNSENLWRILRDVGEPEEVLFVAAVLLWYDPAGWKSAVMLIAGVLGAGGVSAVIKPLVGRLRPIGYLNTGIFVHEHGFLFHWTRRGWALVHSAGHLGAAAASRLATAWQSLPTGHTNNGLSLFEPMRNFINQVDLSFPSGHATAAFAMAAVMIYLSPRGRILFLIVAWGTAFSRMVMQAHFYSDIIAGSTIGWFVGFGITIWMGERLGVPQRHWSPTLGNSLA